MADKYVYGKTEAVTYIDGKRVAVHIDEPWHANDPAVKARPDLFSDDPRDENVRGTVPVERATAEPGEKRNVPRRKKTAAQ